MSTRARIATVCQGQRFFRTVAENRVENGLQLASAEEVFAANGVFFRNASFSGQKNAEDENPEPVKLTTKQKIELAANGTKMIDIPVEDGTTAGVVLGVPIAVSATLMDETGAVVGESKGGIPAMKELFRAISVKRPVKKGTWKLKLENLGNVPATAFVGGLTGQTPVSDLVVTAQRGSGETAAVTAKWIAGGSRVLNAKIFATLANGTIIDLLDDGRHGDGAAGDGVFGATITKVGTADNFVEVKAESEGLVRFAIAKLDTTAKPAGKPRR